MVGLGLIGSAVTRRLIAAGIPVVGYDIDAARRDSLAALGVRAAGSLAELAAGRRPLHPRGLRHAAGGGCHRGSRRIARSAPAIARARSIVSVSTCDPERIRALGERVRSRGATLLECPLSGTSDQVAKRRRRRPRRGRRGAHRRHRATFSPRSASATIFLGALGNGNKTKLADQPHPRPEPRGAGGGPRLRRAARPAARRLPGGGARLRRLFAGRWT